MKKWLFFAVVALCALALDRVPFEKTDVANLRPVQVLSVRVSPSGVELETDTGDEGRGTSVQSALENMKETSQGTIFLETAEFLLLEESVVSMIPELCDVLRPGCGVCIVTEMPDLLDAALYLSAHRPQVSVNDVRSGMPVTDRLGVQDGRMMLLEADSK